LCAKKKRGKVQEMRRKGRHGGRRTGNVNDFGSTKKQEESPLTKGDEEA
jgi:hypothetical protein